VDNVAEQKYENDYQRKISHLNQFLAFFFVPAGLFLAGIG
jgi:hypothetical protein